MNDIKIKNITFEMLDECADLYMNTYSQEPWNESWSSKDVVVNFYKNHYENNYFRGFVAIKNETIVGVSVGFLKSWIKGMEYYIDDFFIRPDYQGQGIGSKFMKAIKDELILQNIHAIILCTERDYPAYKFYEKMGFKSFQDTIYLGIEF